MSVVLYPPPANAPRLRTVTQKQVLSWRPCWIRDGQATRLGALMALAPAEATARDALRICREGGVSAEDTLWLLLRPDWWECPDVVLRVLACDYASAVLEPDSDQRSLEAVRVAWRFAQGGATRTDLANAWNAAWNAAWDTAGYAARDVARTAWSAAGTAVWDATGAVRDASLNAAWSAAGAAAWASPVASQVQRIADLLALGGAS